MTDMTAQAVREGLAAAYGGYLAELRQAGTVWEQKPVGAAEGEDAWCARQVAEHIAGSWGFFGAGIAAALGVPGPTPARPSLADVDEAVNATEAGHDAFNAVIDPLEDDQLAVEMDHPRLGKHSIGGILAIVTSHLGDHAGQLRTLRTG